MAIKLLISNPAASIINARDCLRNSWIETQEGALYSYFDVKNYLLATFCSEDVIAEAVRDTTSCTQPPAGPPFHITKHCVTSSSVMELYMTKQL